MGKTALICVLNSENEERINESITRYRVDTLLMLTDKSHRDHLYDRSEEFRGPFSKVGVNMKNFDDTLTEIVRLIRVFDHDDRVFINLSGAPELVMAAMISAVYSMPQRKNVKLIMQTEGEERAQKSFGGDRNNIMSKQGFHLLMAQSLSSTEHIEIPVLPIEELTEKDKEVLLFLYKHKEVDSIKELLGHVDISRSTFQYRLEKLKELGLVETREQRQRVGMKLTRAGELYVRAHVRKV